MINSTHTHLFALYHATLSAYCSEVGQRVVVTDQQLMARITAVLRLKVGASCILFDRTVHALCEVLEIAKKQVTLVCKSINKNPSYKPVITVLMPLLKKDDLATALADLVAVGVSFIQLVLTEKVQRSWGGAHELERLERIIIASAEQSKNFAIPVLYPPINLQVALAQHSLILCGDPDGVPLQTALNSISQHKPQSYTLLVGPESDFSPSEKNMLLNNSSVVRCALTPTVLKSCLAITILAGAVRSWYYTKEYVLR